jgi:hypothetical protein
MTLRVVVIALLQQIARTKRLQVSLEETPSEAMIEALRQSDEDIKARRVSPGFTNIENIEDAMAWLNDPNATYQNGERKSDDEV